VTQFLGTHQNRIDAKGRVSIPAPFRNALRVLGGDVDGTIGLVLRPSHTHACIEAWPPATFARLASPLDGLDLFSSAHDDLAAALFADATTVEADKEGRIVLPEGFSAHAGLTSSVVFMGLGQIFQIWEPEAAAKRREAARAAARSVTLPARMLQGAGGA
jgi:MraZ protein